MYRNDRDTGAGFAVGVISGAVVGAGLALLFAPKSGTALRADIAGSVDAIATLAEHANVVVLTNLQDHRAEDRTRQLAEHGIHLKVFTNQGPKGPALQAILDEYSPSRAVFIDDLAQHHGSVAEIAPHVDRLHLCGEPRIAPHISCAHVAGHAHARIDTWEHALPWLLGRLHGENDV